MTGDTRSRLIQTTAVLLQRQGYAATGINQIIQESGAPKGSLYYHFPGGKEELTAAAMDYLTDIFIEQAQKTAAQCAGPAETYVKIIDIFINNLERSGFLEGGFIASVTHDLVAHLPLISKAALRLYEREMEFATGELISGGFSDQKASTLASILISTLEGAIVLSKAYRNTEPLRTLRSWSGAYFNNKS